MGLNTIYVQIVVSWHSFVERWREAITQFRENSCFPEVLQNIQENSKRILRMVKMKFVNELPAGCDLTEHYKDIFRRKTRWELIVLSSAVCGIEFCYAAETAFVTPTLLSLGLDIKYATMIWCLSPIIGFFATPILGSLSDRCMSKLGRRRPFIILLALGILAGLILVPNGESIGIVLGDLSQQNNSTRDDDATISSQKNNNHQTQTWGILFTAIGVILLDFCSDAGQSPSRAYLLDVTVPEDHSIGLSTFTMMAGLGGSIGYLMGSINWEDTDIGRSIGGHVKAVFILVTIFFVICLLLTISSFSEIPLYVLNNEKTDHSNEKIKVGSYEELGDELEKDTEKEAIVDKDINYGSITAQSFNQNLDEIDSTEKTVQNTATFEERNDEAPTLKQYLLSILHMPNSIKILCLTNFFSWMSLLCYSLYFTDFVGESVFGGNPKQSVESREYKLYEEGVRFGSGGMALYSISCSCYSYIIQSLINKCGAKPIYIGGQLVYSFGMVIMALCRHKVAVILLSSTAGLMYATLFTMPYLLVARYHSMRKVMVCMFATGVLDLLYAYASYICHNHKLKIKVLNL